MTDAFDFDLFDTVVVRVRENGTSGNLRAKFVAEVNEIHVSKVGPNRVSLRVPWGHDFEKANLSEHDAEFEVVDDPEEVVF